MIIFRKKKYLFWCLQKIVTLKSSGGKVHNLLITTRCKFLKNTNLTRNLKIKKIYHKNYSGTQSIGHIRFKKIQTSIIASNLKRLFVKYLELAKPLRRLLYSQSFQPQIPG